AEYRDREIPEQAVAGGDAIGDQVPRTHGDSIRALKDDSSLRDPPSRPAVAGGGSAGSGYFFFQAEDGIRAYKVTGVQTCALPICPRRRVARARGRSRSRGR